MLRTTSPLLLALSLTSSFANAGFYGGFGAGPDFVDFGAYSHIFGTQPDQTVNLNVNNYSHMAATGGFGTLFVGLGRLVGEYWYMAIEANGNISAARSHTLNHEFIHHNFADTFIKIRNSLGASLIGGYQYRPTTLFYARAGVTESKFRQKTSDPSLANFSVNKSGFRYGVGIKEDLTERVAIRMDYSNIGYKSFTTHTFDAPNLVLKTTLIKPIEQLVEFAIVVNFS